MCWCEYSEHAWGLSPLLLLSGIKKKGAVVKDSPEQQAGNVSLLDLQTCWWLLLCKHQLDGSCSPRLAWGSRQYIIFIFWKERLRKKNWRELLEASAIGAQEPLMSNAPSVYYFMLCVLCWCCFSLQSPISFSWQKVGCLLLGQQPLPNVVVNLSELTLSFVGCQGSTG